MLNFTKTVKMLIAFILMGSLFANTLSLDNNGDGTWDVNYTSTAAIAGFQFNIDGATVSAGSGGEAAAAGFMVSAAGSTVIGFSLSGASLPAGDHLMTTLTIDGDPTGLSNIVISDSSGTSLDFVFLAVYVVEVGADGNSFSPADLQIQPGETVQWVNIDGFHNVDGSTDTYPNNPDSFYSGSPSNDTWTYSFTFEIEGSYDYDCSPHASGGMVGTIMVGVPTCDDESACNTGAEGDCEFAEENSDCDGNCTADLDCLGECGGMAMDDECGICDGDGSSCLGIALSFSNVNTAAGTMDIYMVNELELGGFQI